MGVSEVDKFLAEHREFFEFLEEWFRSLEIIQLRDLTDNGNDPRKLAILSEDLVKGFTTVGRLASPRIAGMLPEVVRLFNAAHALGVHDFIFPQDSHPADSPQFDAYGPHCITGTVEAETVDELAFLPYADEFTIMPKVSLNPAVGTMMDRWFDERQTIESVIIMGDCTDLCVYQAAMHLKIRSNAIHRRLRIIVPEDCVQTYDYGIEEARECGTMPHDGELMHRIFLYHMALNGIDIVKHVE